MSKIPPVKKPTDIEILSDAKADVAPSIVSPKQQEPPKKHAFKSARPATITRPQTAIAKANEEQTVKVSAKADLMSPTHQKSE